MTTPQKNTIVLLAIIFIFISQFCNAATINSARVTQCAGYSICNYQSVNATIADAYAVPGMTYSNRSALAWASRFLGGHIYFDLSTGYQDPYLDGVRQVLVANGGTGYISAPTVVFSGPGCGVNPAATANVALGHITSVTVTTPGWTCFGGVSVSFTGGGGSGAIAYAVLGGSGNLGVPGEGTSGTIARISDLTGSTAPIIILEDGANDRNLGISVAQTEANLQSIWSSLTGSGKTVIDHIEGPIKTSAGLFTSNQYKQVTQTNRWRGQWARDTQSVIAGTIPTVITLDTTAEETDATNSSGDPLPNMRDAFGVHPLTAAAMIDGWKLAQQLAPILGIQPTKNTTNQVDLYDATNNPLGFLNTDPFMTVNGGYNPSPCTGSPADHWAISRDVGTATGSCSVAVSARTDGYSGNQMVFTASLGSGNATEFYSFSWYDTPANYHINAGDKIYGQCDIEVSNTHNLNWLEFDVVPWDSGFVTLFDLNDGDNAVSNDHYPDTGTIGSLTSSTPLTFRTPVYTFPTGGAFTAIANVKTVMHIGFDASGGAGSAGGTFKISNCGIRKYQ